MFSKISSLDTKDPWIYSEESMFGPKAAFSSLAVDNVEKAQEFYTKTLGLEVGNSMIGLKIHLPGGATIFVYPKDNHRPAEFTVLNFSVDNIDEAVDALVKEGVVFEKYEGFHQDEKGIARGLSVGKGPDIAWFKDPAGNILSIVQEK